MKEFPLVVFTVLAQAAVGLFIAATALNEWVAPLPGPWVYGTVLGLMSAAGLAALFHLGKPQRAGWAASNWRSSWLSREVASASLFVLAAGALWALNLAEIDHQTARLALAAVGAAGGAALIYSMARVYMLPVALPWNTNLTLAAFATSAGLLGSLGTAALAGGLALTYSIPSANIAASILRWAGGSALVMAVGEIILIQLGSINAAETASSAGQAEGELEGAYPAPRTDRTGQGLRLVLLALTAGATGSALAHLTIPYDFRLAALTMLVAAAAGLAEVVVGRMLFYGGYYRKGV